MYLLIEFFIVKPIEYHDVAEFKTALHVAIGDKNGDQ